MSLLPWHRQLADQIEKLIASARLPHGILIIATEGWGEIVFTQWLALTLLEQPLELNARELAHPDLRWVTADGAEIKVEAIREIGQFAYKTSRGGGRKVVVLEDAHRLNRNAANALLKTLEEPPNDTYVLLASSHPGRLLPTIRSRCQRFVIHPAPASAKAWLVDEWGDANVEERLQDHAGAPLPVAAELAEGGQPLSRTLGAIVTSAEPLTLLDDLLARDPGQVTGGWYRRVKAMLARNGFCADSDPSARSLLEFADELLWVRHQLLNTNSANARLLLGRLVVKWHGLGT